jgi:hypothetical protein
MIPLRQRFIDDLRIRNYSPKTIESYVAGVVRLAEHFGGSPDLLGPEDIRAFQLHLIQRRVSWSQFNQIVSALRLLYRVTLGRPEHVPYIAYGKRPKALPSVLSPEEVSRLIQAAAPGRDRVLLQVTYGRGLRLSELLSLQLWSQWGGPAEPGTADVTGTVTHLLDWACCWRRAGLQQPCSKKSLFGTLGAIPVLEAQRSPAPQRPRARSFGDERRFNMWLEMRACVVSLLLCSDILTVPATAQETKPVGASPEALSYLEKALDMMQNRSLRRDKIDWPKLRTKALAKAGAAQTPAQTHAAIRFALEQLNEKHSFLAPPPKSLDALLDKLLAPRVPEPAGRIIDGRWGYALVPACDGSREGAGKKYLAKLLGVVRRLDERNPDGWIIDLRGNGGGDMWPMLAGIGPILGQGEVGAFVGPDGSKKKWSYRDGKALEGKEVAEAAAEVYRLKRADPPVAVLTDGKTASSGEAIAIAFRGRLKSRSYGQPTAGLSTANEAIRLNDGATLCLTVATMADRTGRVYGGAVVPDEKVEGKGKEDAVLGAAATWLQMQAKVRAPK